MALIVNVKSEVYDFWSDLCNNFLPIKYLTMKQNFEFVIDGVHIHRLINSMFWLFILFSACFLSFTNFFQVFLRTSKIKFYKRKQFSRAVWNIAFYAASVTFLFLYHKYMISPELVDNSGSLFPKYENTIFYKSQPCERFQIYSIVIFTFYLHSALLDFKDTDYFEAASKIIYSLALVALISYRYENYFVCLNINMGVFHVFTECLTLFALQTSSKSILVYQIFLGLRIISWSHVFINMLPFKYLLPTLFNKDFKVFLNLFIWWWYSLSIWNSPVLQYFYHQIYHNTPLDCVGEGSAAKCILLRDNVDHRHFKALKKAYLEVKLAHEKMYSHDAQPSENASAKAFQTIKCVMTLKRKLRRIREGKDSSSDEENQQPRPHLAQ